MLQNREKYFREDIYVPCNQNCSYCFLNYREVLTENRLFNFLKPYELADMILDVHHQVKTINKGEILASEGDPLNYLIIIIEGKLIGEMMDFEGKIFRVEQLSAPDTIATAFLFGNSPGFPVTVTAVEETKLLLIHKEELLVLFSKYPVIMKNFMDLISDRAQFLSKRIKLMSLSTLKARISFYLLELVKKTGRLDFIIPNTQQELAEIFGVARPSVGRALREMHNSGCIYTRGKKISILNKNKLSTLLN